MDMHGFIDKIYPRVVVKLLYSYHVRLYLYVLIYNRELCLIFYTRMYLPLPLCVPLYVIDCLSLVCHPPPLLFCGVSFYIRKSFFLHPLPENASLDVTLLPRKFPGCFANWDAVVWFTCI